MNCVKRKYKTEKDAELALEYLKDVKKIYRREKHPIRHYFCEYCNNFHLTSKPASVEEIELIHVLRFQDFLEKQRIKAEMGKMFEAHNKPLSKREKERTTRTRKNYKNATTNH